MCVHTHGMEYHLAIKTNEILPFVATCIDLEGIVLSKISQGKTNGHMIQVICRI